MTDTTTKNQLPELPLSMVRKLKALKAQEDKTEFYDTIAALRVNNWTLKSIAEGLGYSRSIVSIWESKSTKNPEDLPPVDEIPDDLDDRLRPIYSQYRLTEDQAAELYMLTKTAAEVRRYTKPDAPERKAAERLEELLHYYKEQGASLNTLKVACGVSRRAVAQRLEKREKAKKREKAEQN
jgi:transcriptional regulator with XRE-family HTH domain